MTEPDWLLPGAIKEEQSVTPNWEKLDQRLIEGVIVKEVRHVPTSYGHLTELFRTEWQLGAKAQFASPIADFCNKIGTLLPQAHAAACPQLAKADLASLHADWRATGASPRLKRRSRKSSRSCAS